jgi:hypothetical protein
MDSTAQDDSGRSMKDEDTACPYTRIGLSPEPYRATVVRRHEPGIVNELRTCHEPVVS